MNGVRSVTLGRLLGIRERWRYLPLAIAGVYLIVLVTQFAAIVRAIYQNADAPAPLQLAELLSAHSGAVVVGQSPWYSTLLFGLATRGIPFWRRRRTGEPVRAAEAVRGRAA
jgi:hypothetical protein